ncbi:MAG: hypothetical protein FWE76_08690, partial [Symbiobacteriaceae bacterium]|nr:hypothetical protein [Symbiobacteriaceae bacterium]
MSKGLKKSLCLLLLVSLLLCSCGTTESVSSTTNPTNPFGAIGALAGVSGSASTPATSPASSGVSLPIGSTQPVGNTVDPTRPANTYGEGAGSNLPLGLTLAAPAQLKAQSDSKNDPISIAALVGPWVSNRSSIRTDWGFSDDGYFYKNVMITHTHLNSTYHAGYWSYGSYYDTWTPGYYTYNTTYTYSYLDTLIGEYRVKGGVIEFHHIVAINRTVFEDDWYYKTKRSVSMTQLQSQATSARFNDDFSVEYEFITPSRFRMRDGSEDDDFFWDFKDVAHNVAIPSHQIPAVAWPKDVLSPNMPQFTTKGRYRLTSLSYKGDNQQSNPESMTVSVVIDKTEALKEVDAYSTTLKSSGWWVEEYKLESDTTSISYDARKGMYKLRLSQGRGSGTYTDTIVIESIRYPEGSWPKGWAEAGIVKPDNAPIIGIIDLSSWEITEDVTIYPEFDKIDAAAAEKFLQSLVPKGYTIDGEGYYREAWNYLRLDGRIYRVSVRVDEVYGEITKFRYTLRYYEDGVWPAQWSGVKLTPPPTNTGIAGAIDMSDWGDHESYSSSDTYYIKFLDVDDAAIAAYFKSLEQLGFTKPEYSYRERELYNFLWIDDELYKVTVSDNEGDELAYLTYSFRYYEKGVWPEIWLQAGLPQPSAEAIAGAIDMSEWGDHEGYSSTDYFRIDFLNTSESQVAAYFKQLEAAGFSRPEYSYSERELFAFLRIAGEYYRVVVRDEAGEELWRINYEFRYYADGEWPSIWTQAGLTQPPQTQIVGEINMEEWGDHAWSSRNYYYVKFLGLDEAKMTSYFDSLVKAGFMLPEYSYNDLSVVNFLRIANEWYKVTVTDRENEEIPELAYEFSYYKDGVWPKNDLPAEV